MPRRESDKMQLTLANYLAINASFPNPFLFALTNRGFYSEINNLLNAILFGLATKRRLFVDQSGFADGQLQWSDLYSSELPWSTIEHRPKIDSHWMSLGVQSEGFEAINAPVNRWFRWRRFFFSRSYGYLGSTRAAKGYLARLFCRPRVLLPCPGSLSTPYAAIHVRRGDKVAGYDADGRFLVEGDDVPLVSYLQLIRKKAPKVRNLFVMTDDYRVIQGLRSIDETFQIHSFCPPTELGYTQLAFQDLSSSSKTDAIRRLIAEVEIASQSQAFVGCYKSNVSRYIVQVHAHPDRCFSVDAFKKWFPS